MWPQDMQKAFLVWLGRSWTIVCWANLIMSLVLISLYCDNPQRQHKEIKTSDSNTGTKTRAAEFTLLQSWRLQVFRKLDHSVICQVASTSMRNSVHVLHNVIAKKPAKLSDQSWVGIGHNLLLANQLSATPNTLCWSWSQLNHAFLWDSATKGS